MKDESRMNSIMNGDDGADKKDLNFKVPADFHADFKVFAAQHGVSMAEILFRSFHLYRTAVSWTR
ncbi:hypothetical protein A6A05_15330 [Magnetospirillum moscoviense]|uniref:Uncharacterized protein n=1 Tax=Magnetospirillum moscoviense TaxID=1437059 RepID=A0A178MJU2_9PROT|nr:hypothetical protein A6A05_15330 [Magnetospirillum moscoviense]